MTQYQKLFDKSEIEYITPFLKLWMSFNNWYKQDLENVRTDRNAINEYKNQGQIKTEFLRLLNGRSNEDVKFQDALASFVKNVVECTFDSFEYPNDLFTRNPSERVIQSKSLVFLSPNNKEFYFSSGDENRLFENTLELIYQVRCKLVHGDFDIEDRFFIDLVENSYRILYPIINRILQNTEDRKFFCKNRRGTKAQSIFDEGRVIVLKDSKICKEIVDSYDKKEERIQILNEKAEERDNYFVVLENIDFQTPSAASSFCLGNSSNGWNDWKDKNGKTMNDVLRNN